MIAASRLWAYIAALALVLAGCSPGPVQPAPKPQVLSFQVTTRDGVFEAAAPVSSGEPHGGSVRQPNVTLRATVKHADAVRFVIGSMVGKDGPVEQLGPFTPGASGQVEATWTLPKPGFRYIIWAEAIRKPAGAVAEGDLVDSAGNLVGSSGPVRLESGPTPYGNASGG